MTTTGISEARRQLDELADQRDRLWAQGRDREARTLTASIVRLVRVLDANEGNPEVSDRELDLVALVECLGRMVDEALEHGTVSGLDLHYTGGVNDNIYDVVNPVLQARYGLVDPDGLMDDDQFDRALEERDRPHNERVQVWRDRLRESLAQDEAFELARTAAAEKA